MAWNTSGTLSLSLASRHDAGFNYVTVNTRTLIKNGLIPMSFDEFSRKFKQGDVFLIQLNGQVNVCAKINRANLTTMAFHCPKTVQMPVWEVDGAKPVEVSAHMCGFTGLRLGNHETSQPQSVKPCCSDDRHPAGHSQPCEYEEGQTQFNAAKNLPLTAKIPLAGVGDRCIISVDLDGIPLDHKMMFMNFVKNNMELFNGKVFTV